jgi:hypothetical protein
LELSYLSVPELTRLAGGDPWKVDLTIQSGSPGQINELATAFHDAGVCMGDTSQEFNEAKRRFEAAWDRQDGGGHPINDSDEVTRATTSLNLDKEELARVAVDLGNISAALAETQQSSHSTIQELEASLQRIDDAIAAAVEQNGVVVDENNIAPLKNIAVQEVRDALSSIGNSRDAYVAELASAMDSMRASGYLPDAVDAADGDGLSGTVAARGEAADYNFQQRATDLALVNGGGPMTPERAAAAARLRDYDTIQNPSSDPTATNLAGERLDDFQTSRFPPGSLPPDPVLGADPQRRALVRQEWQRQLEQGSLAMPPMSPDEATAWMDQQEAQARVVAMDAMVKGLENQGLSRGAATDVAQALAQGATLRDIAATAGPLSEIKQLDGALSDGKHSLPWERYSTADLRAISGLGKVLGGLGSFSEIAFAWNDYTNGAAPGKTFGGLAGSLTGGAGGGALLGFAGGWALGPGGAFVGAITGGLLGGELLKHAGSAVGSNFDR